MAWLLGTTFILTLGELYLSPVGLSFVTKMAPAWMVSMMMGIWFLSSFFGNYLSGYLGTYWGRMSPEHFFAVLTGSGPRRRDRDPAARAPDRAARVRWMRRLPAGLMRSALPVRIKYPVDVTG